MSTHAITMPAADDVGKFATAVATVTGVVGAGWALVMRIRARRRREREVREAEARATRYLLDAVRHTLNAIMPDDERHYLSTDELVRQKLLIDQVRDALWRYDGHDSERATEEEAEERIIRVITRTQRIQMKQREPKA